MAVRIPDENTLGGLEVRAPSGLSSIPTPNVGAAYQAWAGAAKEIAQAADVFAQRAAEDSALEAETRVREQVRAMLYDPEKGYLATARGKDAATKMKPFTDSIEKTISSAIPTMPGAARLFESRMRSLRAGAADTITRHAGAEIEKYETQTFDGMLRSFVQGTSTDPAQLLDNLRAAEPVVESRIGRLGLAGPAADEFRRASLGALHVAAIDKLLTGGATEEAKRLFKEATDSKALTLEQFAAIDKRIKPETDMHEGTRLAADVFGRVAAGELTSVEAQKDLATRAKNPEMLRYAKAQLNELERAQARDHGIAMGGFFDAYLAVAERQGPFAAKQAMLRDGSAYRSLRGKALAEAEAYMERQINEAQVKSRISKAEREEAMLEDPQSIEIMAMYFDNPDLLAKLDPREISHLQVTKIGRTNAAALKQMQSKLKAESQDALKQALAPAVLDNYAPEAYKKDTPTARRQLKLFQESIKAEGLRGFAATGHVPDEAAIKTIASRVLLRTPVSGIASFFGAKGVEFSNAPPDAMFKIAEDIPEMRRDQLGAAVDKARAYLKREPTMEEVATVVRVLTPKAPEKKGAVAPGARAPKLSPQNIQDASNSFMAERAGSR